MDIVENVGYLAQDPECPDELGVIFSLSGEQQSELREGDSVSIIGRSAMCLLGIDFRARPGYDYYHSIVDDVAGVLVPLEITPPATTTGSRLLDDVRNLPTNSHGMYIHGEQEQALPFARILRHTNLVAMSKRAVADAIRDNLIVIGQPTEGSIPRRKNWNINDDGSVTMPLAHLEFLFHHDIMDTPEKRLNILHHGRAGLRPYVDTAERDPEDTLSIFTVGGVLFSAGPFFWKVRTTVSDGQYQQLETGSFGDGNRVNGVGAHLPSWERHRQVELLSKDVTEPLRYGEAQVTIEFFRPKRVIDTTVNWGALSHQERAKIHLNGMDPLTTLLDADPRIFEDLYAKFAAEDLNAVVITPHGNTAVSVSETAKFNGQKIANAVSKHGVTRGHDIEDLRWASELLANVSDRSRVAIVNSLRPSDASRIVEEQDVNGLLVRDWGKVAFTEHEHTALTGLARRGVNLGWYMDGEFREMHRSGLWASPEAADRLSQLELVVAMFGGHNDQLREPLQPQVDEFFARLADLMDPALIAAAHGNGEGMMLAGHRGARASNVMSLGSGIAAEAKGQGGFNNEPEAVVHSVSVDWLHRQNILDMLKTVSIYNIGGFGTGTEQFAALTTQKLWEVLPSPQIAVDLSGIFQDAKRWADKISSLEEIVLDDGTQIPLTRPLAQPWVANTLHLVPNYHEAGAIVEAFVRDPASYWDNAGIPPIEIAHALPLHSARMALMGMKLPSYMRAAAEKYARSA